MKTIISNEVLFSCTLELDRVKKLSLCKQSYSDGTCFYTLKDRFGNFKVYHGSSDIKDLINQIKHEIKIEKEYASIDLIEKYPEVRKIHDGVIQWKENILSNLQALIA